MIISLLLHMHRWQGILRIGTTNLLIDVPYRVFATDLGTWEEMSNHSRILGSSVHAIHFKIFRMCGSGPEFAMKPFGIGI